MQNSCPKVIDITHGKYTISLISILDEAGWQAEYALLLGEQILLPWSKSTITNAPREKDALDAALDEAVSKLREIT